MWAAPSSPASAAGSKSNRPTTVSPPSRARSRGQAKSSMVELNRPPGDRGRGRRPRPTPLRQPVAAGRPGAARLTGHGAVDALQVFEVGELDRDLAPLRPHGDAHTRFEVFAQQLLELEQSRGTHAAALGLARWSV